jgi:hypothetical protein
MRARKTAVGGNAREWLWHNHCDHTGSRGMGPWGGNVMLWTIVVLLLIFWLLGFAFDVAGGIIHVLLVIALVLFVVNLITGRRTTV